MEQISEVADSLTHNDVLEITKSTLRSILGAESVLSDLPQDIILEEIQSLTAVQHGKSITIFVSRDVEEPLKVIVPHDAKVRDLKKAIARHFELHQRRTGIKVKISWKYIWKTYNLNFDSLTLDDDESSISDYGITNKVTLMFKKKRKKPKIK